RRLQERVDRFLAIFATVCRKRAELSRRSGFSARRFAERRWNAKKSRVGWDAAFLGGRQRLRRRR
ncbi:MAG: hypothetical protein IKY61_07170, partial [Thermoguttaceae bacterium]|nr:hypothetical protein [Thermoguttaceae bacterium]